MNRFEHKDSDFIFPFVEYAPENSDGCLPLILQLHGAGERGNNLSLVDTHGFSKFIADKDIKARFILPQCPSNTFWAARVESILSFIAQLKTRFNVDESRIYLTGLSMGGFGTWFVAMASPSTFAAIAPVCGGGMSWNASVLKKLPIWVFHGSDDTTVLPVYSDMMVEALQKCGADVTYTRLDGVRHNVWDFTYDQALLDWLLSKSKQNPPRKESKCPAK